MVVDTEKSRSVLLFNCRTDEVFYSFSDSRPRLCCLGMYALPQQKALQMFTQTEAENVFLFLRISKRRILDILLLQIVWLSFQKWIWCECWKLQWSLPAIYFSNEICWARYTSEPTNGLLSSILPSHNSALSSFIRDPFEESLVLSEMYLSMGHRRGNTGVWRKSLLLQIFPDAEREIGFSTLNPEGNEKR